MQYTYKYTDNVVRTDIKLLDEFTTSLGFMKIMS